MTSEEIAAINRDAVPRFSSFAPDLLPMPGKKKRISDVIDQEILITDFRIKQSKKREGTECMQLQFVFNNEICILFTGSAVLIDQVRTAKEKQPGPFVAVISKIDRYYSFQ